MPGSAWAAGEEFGEPVGVGGLAVGIQENDPRGAGFAHAAIEDDAGDVFIGADADELGRVGIRG